MTRIGGPPCRPSSSTSQPARRRTAWRAAARAVTLAMVAPVVYPTDEPVGRPRSSSSQPAATSSTTAAAGEWMNRPTFWSHVDTSQSVARAAGTEPPMTNPK